MRPIDADALKEAVDNGWKPDMMVSELWEIIDESPTVGGWISVKDRLPEEDGTMRGYLVTVGNWVGMMPFFGGAFRENLHGKEPDYPVTHWMPLPEPPMEGRRRDE